MPSSSGHARKRQYQPSIDSYFHRDAENHTVLERQRIQSPLPAETQASLLSVGMRVRKSVPEGYKTHKTIGVHISPIPSTAPSTQAKRRNGAVNVRELMPFCGLHKIGGFAAQHVPHSSAPAVMEPSEEGYEDDDDQYDLPDLTISQSSLPATQDSFASFPTARSALSRKREYEEDIEHDLDAFFNDDHAMDSTVPLRLRDDRVIAKMKSTSLHRRGAGGAWNLVGAGDFDEAAFLVPDGTCMDVDDS